MYCPGNKYFHHKFYFMCDDCDILQILDINCCPVPRVNCILFHVSHNQQTPDFGGIVNRSGKPIPTSTSGVFLVDT